MRYWTGGWLLLAILLAVGCKPDPFVDDGDFPEEIGQILITNCATAGCHDERSNGQEGRLSCASWESIFRGSRSGAALVPYRPDQSYLLFFVNNDTTLGITQNPRMPFNQPPLSTEDYLKLVDWIQSGAPSKQGNIKFADNPLRNKLYVANQGCDQVFVLDLGSQLVMRVIDVGQIPGFTEAPHMLRVSPDGEYWYAIFLASNPYIEKYSARDDSYLGKIEIGFGDWNTLTLSEDGRYAFAVSFASQRVQVADLENMVAIPGGIVMPEQLHGQAIHPDFTSLYITQQSKSRLFKLSFTDPMNPDQLDEICLTPNCIPLGVELKPHEVAFTPEGDKYLVTCQGTGEVRILQTSNDSLLAVIAVGQDPTEIAFDAQTHQAFITCMNDQQTFASDPNKLGSIAVVNYQTHTKVTSLYSGFEPHGIIVDAEARTVYVANRNVTTGGPAPHHSTACAGRNGYLTSIDIPTLTVNPDFKVEMSTDPYSVMLRKTN